MRNTYRAVHLDAAQHDHASSCASEDVHQLFRLRTRTDDQVAHDIGSKGLRLLSAGSDLVAVTANFVHARGCRCGAAMKHRQNVPLLLECSNDEPPDEAIPANEKEAHREQ